MELQKHLMTLNATDEDGNLLKDENGDQVVTLGVKSVVEGYKKKILLILYWQNMIGTL